jgi:hypothetical protein
MSFSLVAYNFYNEQISPIPLNGKRPVIKDWSKFSKQLIEEDELDFYIDHFSNSNIGIVLGAASGIIAVDIDKEDALTSVPLSPWVKKGKKGETRFFQYNGEPATKRHDIGIEILSDGNQTVMPPSIHPETNLPYVWIRKDGTKEDLPKLDASFVAKIVKHHSTNNITESDGSRCNHGSHSKLSEMLIAALNNGDDVQTITNSLLDYDLKINPTVSYFTCPSRKEFRTSNRIVNCTQFILDAMKRYPQLVTNSKRIEIVELSEEPTNILYDYKESKLPHFRGVAQEIFNYIYATSPIKRTRFAVASTLSIMSTVLGNRYSCHGFHPNMYLLIAAPSGGGKNHYLRSPYRILKQAGVRDIIGGSPESDSGILKDLEKRPTRLDCFDEAARLFSMMSDKQNSYASKMADVYADLFSAVGGYYQGKTLKDKTIGECESPSISLLCALTVEDFSKTFTTDLIAKGIGARFLFFPDKENRDVTLENKLDIMLPDSITNFIKATRKISDQENIDLTGKPPKSTNLLLPKRLEKRCEEIINQFKRLGETGENSYSPIYNRLGENIMKMIIIDTVSRYETVISDECVDWAYKWGVAYSDSLKTFLEDTIGQNSIRKKIENYIFEAGREGLKRRDLYRKYSIRNLPSHVFEQEIKALKQQELIDSVAITAANGVGVVTLFHTKFIR